MKKRIFVIIYVAICLGAIAALAFAQPAMDVQSQRLMRQMRATDIVKMIHESTDSTDIVEMSPGTVVMFRNYRIELEDFAGNRAARLLLGPQEKVYEIGTGVCARAPDAAVSVWLLARTARTAIFVVTRNPALRCTS